MPKDKILPYEYILVIVDHFTSSSPEQVKNTTHAVPRFRGAHVSQSGAPKGDPHRFQCYNKQVLHFCATFGQNIGLRHISSQKK